MFRFIQGFETVRNNADLNAQGWATSATSTGSAVVPLASKVLANSESIRFEQFGGGTNDVSPTFAATTCPAQVDTGATIRSLWNAGGFVFGARGEYRNANNAFIIGDIVTTSVTAGTINQSPTNKIIWDGSKFWSLKTDVANVTTVIISTDLINWTAPATQPTLTPFNISFVNSQIIVSHLDGKISFTSTGATWTLVTIDSGVTAGTTVASSNVVFANSKYYILISSSATSNGRTYTSPDLTTWTLVDNFLAGDGTGGSVHVTLFFDGLRSRVFQLFTNNGGNSQSFARLRSLDFSNVATVNFTSAGLARTGPSSMASDGTATGSLVISFTTGIVMFANGANPTVWTTATTGLPSVADTARQAVAFDVRQSKYIIPTTAGKVAISTDSTGSAWTISNPLYTTRYNLGTAFINNQIVSTGQSVIVNDGAIGWNVRFWTENAQASNAATTAQGSSRLGFAAINSGARSSYVGVYATTAINTGASTAQFGFSSNNTTTGADTPSETYTSSTLIPYPYFELICTATATVNQFSVQVLINGAVVSASPFVIAVAGTGDTTSTLFLTVPDRNQGVSTLPTLISFDDMYVLDFSTAVNNTVMRGINIVKAPLSNDDQAQWTKNPGSASSNFVAASGNSASTAGTFLTSSSVGNKDIYSAVQPFDISGFSVKAIQVEGTLSNTSLAASSAKIGISSSGVAVDTGAVNVSIGVNTYAAKLQEVDPNTTAQWTRAAAIAAKVTLEKVS